MGNIPEPQEPFEQNKNNHEENQDYYHSEGRKSYMKIKTRKNWPPTMDDLLEYISIYSQMNNIKFTSLNYEEFYEKQNKKKVKIKQGKESSRMLTKWKPISSLKKQKSISTPRSDIHEISKAGSRSKNLTQNTNESFQEHPDIKLLHDILDTVAIMEMQNPEGKKSKVPIEMHQLYKVLFEGASQDEDGTTFLDSNNQQQKDLIKLLFKSMDEKITSKNEDVIQTIDVLEFFVKILSQIPDRELLKFGLSLLIEVLKGDFVLQGERPFKSFYCVIFYL